MYRCEACNRVSKPKEPQFRRPVLRQTGHIGREVVLCLKCNDLVERGMSLKELFTEFSPAPRGTLSFEHIKAVESGEDVLEEVI